MEQPLQCEEAVFLFVGTNSISLLVARWTNIIRFYTFSISETNSKISPGWQFKTSQIASKVLNLIALALPVFKMERFDSVISTFSDSSDNGIFRLASMTSKFTIIGMALRFRL